MNTTKAINPWFSPHYSQCAPVLEYTGKPELVYRGVAVFYNYRGSYDYIMAGMAITQRAGLSSKERGRAVIDAILDGRDNGQFPWVCETVRKHLVGLGFSPIAN